MARKQAPALWYKHIDEFLRILGLKRSEFDPNDYLSESNTGRVILLLYVDDILIISISRQRVDALKRPLQEKQERLVFVHQRPYIKALPKKNKLSSCNGHWTPQPMVQQRRRADENTDPHDQSGHENYQSIVRSFMWMINGTRPDLAYTLSLLSRSSSALTLQHLKAASHILRYLRNIANLAI